LRDRRVFLRLIAKMRQKNWVVYAKPPFAGPAAVLAYLSRVDQHPIGTPLKSS
jgi:hypothetical protein